jgi:hypothetical protein
MDIISYEQVKGDEPFMTYTLKNVGIPPLDIIPARTPDWQFKYFELTGDAKNLFKFA